MTPMIQVRFTVKFYVCRTSFVKYGISECFRGLLSRCDSLMFNQAISIHHTIPMGKQIATLRLHLLPTLTDMAESALRKTCPNNLAFAFVWKRDGSDKSILLLFVVGLSLPSILSR